MTGVLYAPDQQIGMSRQIVKKEVIAMITITEEISRSVEDFKDKLRQYQDGKLDNLKAYSSIMGIYKEGPKPTYMVRSRIAGGVTTVRQLKGISAIAQKYGIKIRFTTRQDIQFHSVSIADLGNVLDDLLHCGLTTRGAGGDGVRNVACSPLSGVARDEAFDVTPYMEKVTNHMMQAADSLKLPRKYKIAFSNNAEDTANATVTDIGFIAKIVNGQRGFAVYGGGGLGGNARLALKLEDFIADTDALYYVQAMKQVFAREGDRSNRHKARLRYVVQRLGEEEFSKVLRKELDQLRNSGQELKLSIQPSKSDLAHTQGKSSFPWEEKYQNIVVPQKQAGFYSVYIHPRQAAIDPGELDRLLNFLSGLDNEPTIRLTLTQGFFVRDLREEAVEALLALVAGFSSLYNIGNSVACVGPTICNFGINDSQELLRDILAAFTPAAEAVKEALPRVLVSGCPNSCGQHQKGLIGFTGRRSRGPNGVIPTYAVSFNGKVGPGSARFGDVYGEIAAEKIAGFLIDLAALKIKSGHTDFEQFIETQEQEVKELVLNYSVNRAAN